MGQFVFSREKKFTFTEMTPPQIVKQLDSFIITRKNFGPLVYVEPLTPRFFDFNATTYKDKPNQIFVNAKKKLDKYTLTGTLVHEICHLAGFNHGTGRLTNYFQGREPKLSSVPIAMAADAVAWAKEWRG
jgi:hypothetical protein